MPAPRLPTFVGVITYAASAADFCVYLPADTSKWATFSLTWFGTWTALIICNIVGIVIATAVPVNKAWSDGYAISSGALLLACYNGLKGLGGLCVVILALGSVTMPLSLIQQH